MAAMAKIPQLLATKMVQRAVEGDLPIVRNGDLKDTALANRPDIPLSHAMALYRDNSSYQAMVLPCIVDTDAAKSSTITLLTYVDLQAWSTDQLSLVTKLRGGTDVKALDGIFPTNGRSPAAKLRSALPKATVEAAPADAETPQRKLFKSPKGSEKQQADLAELDEPTAKAAKRAEKCVLNVLLTATERIVEIKEKIEMVRHDRGQRARSLKLQGKLNDMKKTARTAKRTLADFVAAGGIFMPGNEIQWREALSKVKGLGTDLRQAQATAATVCFGKLQAAEREAQRSGVAMQVKPALLISAPEDAQSWLNKYIEYLQGTQRWSEGLTAGNKRNILKDILTDLNSAVGKSVNTRMRSFADLMSALDVEHPNSLKVECATAISGQAPKITDLATLKSRLKANVDNWFAAHQLELLAASRSARVLKTAGVMVSDQIEEELLANHSHMADPGNEGLAAVADRLESDPEQGRRLLDISSVDEQGPAGADANVDAALRNITFSKLGLKAKEAKEATRLAMDMFAEKVGAPFLPDNGKRSNFRLYFEDDSDAAITASRTALHKFREEFGRANKTEQQRKLNAILKRSPIIYPSAEVDAAAGAVDAGGSPKAGKGKKRKSDKLKIASLKAQLASYQAKPNKKPKHGVTLDAAAVQDGEDIFTFLESAAVSTAGVEDYVEEELVDLVIRENTTGGTYQIMVSDVRTYTLDGLSTTQAKIRPLPGATIPTGCFIIAPVSPEHRVDGTRLADGVEEVPTQGEFEWSAKIGNSASGPRLLEPGSVVGTLRPAVNSGLPWNVMIDEFAAGVKFMSEDEDGNEVVSMDLAAVDLVFIDDPKGRGKEVNQLPPEPEDIINELLSYEAVTEISEPPELVETDPTDLRNLNSYTKPECLNLLADFMLTPAIIALTVIYLLCKFMNGRAKDVNEASDLTAPVKIEADVFEVAAGEHLSYTDSLSEMTWIVGPKYGKRTFITIFDEDGNEVASICIDSGFTGQILLKLELLPLLKKHNMVAFVMTLSEEEKRRYKVSTMGSGKQPEIIAKVGLWVHYYAATPEQLNEPGEVSAKNPPGEKCEAFLMALVVKNAGEPSIVAGCLFMALMELIPHCTRRENKMMTSVKAAYGRIINNTMPTELLQSFLNKTKLVGREVQFYNKEAATRMLETSKNLQHPSALARSPQDGQSEAMDEEDENEANRAAALYSAAFSTAPTGSPNRSKRSRFNDEGERQGPS